MNFTPWLLPLPFVSFNLLELESMRVGAGVYYFICVCVTPCILAVVAAIEELQFVAVAIAAVVGSRETER